MKWTNPFKKAAVEENKNITADVKNKLNEHLKAVEDGIRLVEAKQGVKLMENSVLSINTVDDKAEVRFHGYNKVVYTLPYTVFLNAPVERWVIAVSRALAIHLDIYEGRNY